MSVDEKIKVLESFVFGTHESPGVVRRLDNIERQVQTLVEVERERSARTNKLVNGVVLILVAQVVTMIFIAVQ